MRSPLNEDPILREHRRYALARRLLLHGVRTEIIGQITGLTRNRLATVRRRLVLLDDMRPRGPGRSALDVFRGSARGRMEGAALICLGLVFDLPAHAPGSIQGNLGSLERGERLCEAFEAYRAVFPESAAELEDFFLLCRSVMVSRALTLTDCRTCRGLRLDDPLERSSGCSRCDRIG